MDVRLIILAVTFALLIVSAVTFVSSLVRARRIRRLAGPLQEVAHFPTGATQSVDTSLAGLTVDIDPDSPSAALLTPIRTGEWRPPETPAPTADLSAASLTQRIAELPAISQIPEPDFLSESHEPWMAEPAPAPAPAAAPAPAPAPAPAVGPEFGDMPTLSMAPVAAPAAAQSVPLEAILPEVYLDNELEEPANIESHPVPADEDDFDAQIHALLPDVAAVAQADLDSPVLLNSEPIPASEAVPQPAPAPVDLPAATPQIESPPIPEPEPIPQASSEPEPPIVDEFWEDLLREQQTGVPVAATRAPVERPEVRVTAAEAPRPEPEPEPVAGPTRPARPVARVRTAEGTIAEFVPEQQDAGEMQAHARTAAKIPELTMEAPVEMWFGDARVGVKAGTATYDRFRKYADVLLEDLRASGVAGQ